MAARHYQVGKFTAYHFSCLLSGFKIQIDELLVFTLFTDRKRKYSYAEPRFNEKY